MQPRLDHEFFRRDPVSCARELIGATFEWDGCLARIVETEAYAAEGDPACHTFFRPGARDFVQRNAAGKSYVYLNYGVHWLFNNLTKAGCGDGFVLFRALRP
ncbi:MAG: 3-methyladenine glycosylase, partial [Akkermansiaceae bacterium]|nr:3-methyladenine glycosylase [Akkermansiaceae bacterium]